MGRFKQRDREAVRSCTGVCTQEDKKGESEYLSTEMNQTMGIGYGGGRARQLMMMIIDECEGKVMNAMHADDGNSSGRCTNTVIFSEIGNRAARGPVLRMEWELGFLPQEVVVACGGGDARDENV